MIKNKVPRGADLLLTSLAPAIWGSTYLVTTELLPEGIPITVAMLRALPVAFLLMLFVRQLPSKGWWGRVFLLGALNFSLFGVFLFVAAYHLPGGVAATVGAVQPLLVIFFARCFLGSPLIAMSIVAAVSGIGGVGLMVLTPQASLDPIGVVAGVAGAVSMGAGTVLSRKWQPPVSPLTFTAWQIAAGGLLLVPFSMWLEPPLPALTSSNTLGLVYLGLIGTAFTYLLWFRGISRLEPSVVSMLTFLSPVTAIILGWLVLDQRLTSLQIVGVLTVLGSVWLSQKVRARPFGQLHQHAESPNNI